eukprot:SAG22_NODE_54_length_23787_cov_12.917511_13_plen_318_part_00
MVPRPSPLYTSIIPMLPGTRSRYLPGQKNPIGATSTLASAVHGTYSCVYAWQLGRAPAATAGAGAAAMIAAAVATAVSAGVAHALASSPAEEPPPAGGQMDYEQWREKQRRRVAVQAKCAEIFHLFDSDRDGRLDLHEMQSLAARTGGELRADEYAMVCREAGCDPAAGLSGDGLLRVYTGLGLGDADADYAALGLDRAVGAGSPPSPNSGGSRLTVAEVARLKGKVSRLSAQHYQLPDRADTKEGAASILTPKTLHNLWAEMPALLRVQTWALVYSLHGHGASMQTLLARARNIAPTLLLVQTRAGDVFGCVVSED